MGWEDVLKNEGNIESDAKLALQKDRQPIAGQRDSGSSGGHLLHQLLWNPSLPKGEFIGKVRQILIEELGKMGYNEQSNPPLNQYVNSLSEDKMYELAGIDPNSPTYSEDESVGGTPRTRWPETATDMATRSFSYNPRN